MASGAAVLLDLVSGALASKRSALPRRLPVRLLGALALLPPRWWPRRRELAWLLWAVLAAPLRRPALRAAAKHACFAFAPALELCRLLVALLAPLLDADATWLLPALWWLLLALPPLVRTLSAAPACLLLLLLLLVFLSLLFSPTDEVVATASCRAARRRPMV